MDSLAQSVYVSPDSGTLQNELRRDSFISDSTEDTDCCCWV